MSEKYQRIIKYCDKEIDNVLKVFKKQKQKPPVPRNFPPLAGITILSLLFLVLIKVY